MDSLVTGLIWITKPPHSRPLAIISISSLPYFSSVPAFKTDLSIYNN